MVGCAVWVVRAAVVDVRVPVAAVSGLGFGHDFQVVLVHVDLPDPDRVVGAARREELDVRGQEQARQVVFVGFEDSARQQGCGVVVLVHSPNVDIALDLVVRHVGIHIHVEEVWVWRCWGVTYTIVASCEQGPITRHTDTRDRDVLIRNELVGAFALSKVPDSDVATSIRTHEFTLIRVDDHVVHRVGVLVVSLNQARSGVPDSDRHVLRAGDHPLALTVESHACDIVRVALKGHDRVRIGRLDVVEAHHVAAGSGKELLVWGDT